MKIKKMIVLDIKDVLSILISKISKEEDLEKLINILMHNYPLKIDQIKLLPLELILDNLAENICKNPDTETIKELLRNISKKYQFFEKDVKEFLLKKNFQADTQKIEFEDDQIILWEKEIKEINFDERFKKIA